MKVLNTLSIVLLLVFISCIGVNNLTKRNTNQTDEMRKILTVLFQKSVTAKENTSFTTEQINNNWIGNKPASASEINEAELRLGIELPSDYKKFIQIANGYPTYNDAVEPSFEDISQIQYLKDYDPAVIDIWRNAGNEDISSELAKSIIVAGKQEEQWFLLIPPSDNKSKWKYWKFANWIPGEIEYENLEEYFRDVIKGIS